MGLGLRTWKVEGGNGKGHSNTEHRETHDRIKAVCRKARRVLGKKAVEAGLAENSCK